MSETIFPVEYCLKLANFQEWIKNHEFSSEQDSSSLGFLDALNYYGDLRHKGRDLLFWDKDPELQPWPLITFNKTRELDVATNAGFCGLSSAILLYAIKEHFGQEIVIRGTSSLVSVPNLFYITDDPADFEKVNGFKLHHIRLHFPTQDGNAYFIDPTYGQLNRRINRIVIERIEKEKDYYGNFEEIIDVTERLFLLLASPDHLNKKFLSSYPSEFIKKVDQAYKQIFIALGVKPYPNEVPIFLPKTERTKAS